MHPRHNHALQILTLHHRLTELIATPYPRTVVYGKRLVCPARYARTWQYQSKVGVFTANYLSCYRTTTTRSPIKVRLGNAHRPDLQSALLRTWRSFPQSMGSESSAQRMSACPSPRRTLRASGHMAAWLAEKKNSCISLRPTGSTVPFANRLPRTTRTSSPTLYELLHSAGCPIRSLPSSSTVRTCAQGTGSSSITPAILTSNWTPTSSPRSSSLTIQRRSVA